MWLGGNRFEQTIPYIGLSKVYTNSKKSTPTLSVLTCRNMCMLKYTRMYCLTWEGQKLKYSKPTPR